MEVDEQLPSHARSRAGARVKNKAPAKLQITAEQLLREAWERKESGPSAVPKQQITDHDELLEYQRTERQRFEMRIVRNRAHTPLWVRYARWEEDQREILRARSIWERAIDNEYRNPVIWLNYAEMEMRHRFVNHARNVFDRAVALLPRVDQLWLKYAHMEEMLTRLDLARLVYQRWLEWFPESAAYFAFIRFELRHAEPAQARAVYAQLLRAHRNEQSFIKCAKFEEKQGEFARARHVFERASEELPESLLSSSFFLSFAKFEERRKQPNRARAIYKFAVSRFPPGLNAELYRSHANFEKQQGDRHVLEDMLSSKKRQSFEIALEKHPKDYDTWFDLIQLEESISDSTRIREVYERALANIPPVAEKVAWTRYVYIWISFAIWIELSCADIDGAIEVYKRCVKVIPRNHQKFSFGKLWLRYAQAELRRGDVPAARRILGTGLGVLPRKRSLYQAYVELEMALGEVDRAREVYKMWLIRNPSKEVFCALADMEYSLGEISRSQNILEVALETSNGGADVEVWEKLADVCVAAGNEKEAVARFESYVQDFPGMNAWTAYVRMLLGFQAHNESVRNVYQRATVALREAALSSPSRSDDERKFALAFIQSWLEWERTISGSDESSEIGEHVQHVVSQMPKRIEVVEPSAAGPIQVFHIVFPEEEVRGASGAANRLAEAARRWKDAQTKARS